MKVKYPKAIPIFINDTDRILTKYTDTEKYPHMFSEVLKDFFMLGKVFYWNYIINFHPTERETIYTVFFDRDCKVRKIYNIKLKI